MQTSVDFNLRDSGAPVDPTFHGGDLKHAKAVNESKIAENKTLQAQQTLTPHLFQRLSNAGVPVTAASLIAKELEKLEQRIAFLENQRPPHLHKLERR